METPDIKRMKIGEDSEIPPSTSLIELEKQFERRIIPFKNSFKTSLTLDGHEKQISVSMMCPYNSVFNAFSALYKNEESLREFFEAAKNSYPLFNQIIDISELDPYLNKSSGFDIVQEKLHHKWIQFLARNFIEKFQTEDDKINMEGDVNAVISRLLESNKPNDFFSWHQVASKCEKLFCHGFSEEQSHSIMALVLRHDEFICEFENAIIKNLSIMSHECETCKSKINSKIQFRFKNILIINVTIQNDLEIDISHIPKKIELNCEFYELRIVIDHPLSHFKTFYRVNGDNFIEFDDLKQFQELRENLKVKVNPKILIYVKGRREIYQNINYGEYYAPSLKVTIVEDDENSSSEDVIHVNTKTHFTETKTKVKVKVSVESTKYSSDPETNEIFEEIEHYAKHKCYKSGKNHLIIEDRFDVKKFIKVQREFDEKKPATLKSNLDYFAPNPDEPDIYSIKLRNGHECLMNPFRNSFSTTLKIQEKPVKVKVKSMSSFNSIFNAFSELYKNEESLMTIYKNSKDFNQFLDLIIDLNLKFKSLTWNQFGGDEFLTPIKSRSTILHRDWIQFLVEKFDEKFKSFENVIDMQDDLINIVNRFFKANTPKDFYSWKLKPIKCENPSCSGFSVQMSEVILKLVLRSEKNLYDLEKEIDENLSVDCKICGAEISLKSNLDVKDLLIINSYIKNGAKVEISQLSKNIKINNSDYELRVVIDELNQHFRTFYRIKGDKYNELDDSKNFQEIKENFKLEIYPKILIYVRGLRENYTKSKKVEVAISKNFVELNLNENSSGLKVDGNLNYEAQNQYEPIAQKIPFVNAFKINLNVRKKFKIVSIKSLGRFNAIFNAFSALYKYEENTKEIFVMSQNYFLNFVKEIISEISSNDNFDERHKKWAEFLSQNFIDKFIPKFSYSLKDEVNMDGGMSYAISKFFHPNNPGNYSTFTRNPSKCINRSCHGFSEKFVGEKISLKIWSHELVFKFNEKIEEFFANNFFCQLCKTKINSKIEVEFKNLVFIDLLKDNLKIKIDHIPQKIKLNDEDYELRIVIDFSDKHPKTFYRIKGDDFVEFDDRKRFEEIKQNLNIDIDPKYLIYVKGSREIYRRRIFNAPSKVLYQTFLSIKGFDCSWNFLEYGIVLIDPGLILHYLSFNQKFENVSILQKFSTNWKFINENFSFEEKNLFIFAKNVDENDQKFLVFSEENLIQLEKLKSIYNFYETLKNSNIFKFLDKICNVKFTEQPKYFAGNFLKVFDAISKLLTTKEFEEIFLQDKSENILSFITKNVKNRTFLKVWEILEHKIPEKLPDIFYLTDEFGEIAFCKSVNIVFSNNDIYPALWVVAEKYCENFKEFITKCDKSGRKLLQKILEMEPKKLENFLTIANKKLSENEMREILSFTNSSNQNILFSILENSLFFVEKFEIIIEQLEKYFEDEKIQEMFNEIDESGNNFLQRFLTLHNSNEIIEKMTVRFRQIFNLEPDSKVFVMVKKHINGSDLVLPLDRKLVQFL